MLQTDRLILRPPILADFDAFAAFAGDPEAARFVGGVQPRAAAWRGFAATAGAWALQGFAMFSVIERASGAWIGRIGPWQPEGWPGTEIGWALARGAWGRGYAQEGATAAIDWAFDYLGWQEIIHCIAPENTASRVLAKRLGSRLRGPGKLPAPYEDTAVELWGQRREEWRVAR